MFKFKGIPIAALAMILALASTAASAQAPQSAQATFGSGFSGDHDAALVAEMFNQCCANIDVSGASDAACALIGCKPFLINARSFRTVIGPAELNDLPRVAVSF